MKRILYAGLLGLTLMGNGAVGATSPDVVVIQQGDGAPPEREPVVSVNRAVKDNKELEAERKKKAELEKRAPVYRTMAEAAAAGVGVTRTPLPEETQSDWYWWQWVGAGIGGFLCVSVLVGAWLWRRRR